MTVLTQPSSPTQVCTVGNGSGSIGAADVTTVQVSCVAGYTVSGTISGLSGTGLVLQDNGGDSLSINADGTFTFRAALPNGAGYSVTVLTQPSSPTQLCTVVNGSGTISAADVTNVTVKCPPRFAYVANSDSGDVSAYSIDAATGALTAVAGSPYVAGAWPLSVTIDPPASSPTCRTGTPTTSRLT